MKTTNTCGQEPFQSTLLLALCCYVAGTIPPKLSVSVLEAPEAMQDKDGRVSSRHVTVEGGITVSAPTHVKKGDVIVVRTEDSVYLEKGAKAV